LHLPIAHVEAGLRSFDMRMPEEVNRVVTDHISDILLAPSRAAVKNLRREHCRGAIHLTGDVMDETLRQSIGIAEKESRALETLGLRPGGYVLVTIHRAENTDDPSRLSNIVNAIVSAKKRMVFPIHPRTLKALKACGLYGRLSSYELLTMTEPLSYLDFIRLEKYAEKILTDSGGVQREAFLFGVPCVTLRDSTEWVETLTGGWNVLVGTDVRRILRALMSPRPSKSRIEIPRIGRPSMRIAKILAAEVNGNRAQPRRD
jgi:UDP-N-acetylglucosamine 2-epimerase (non-hydrolysing)